MLFSFLQKKIEPNLSFLGVDMHSHLLPGIDDGAEIVQQTVDFAKALQQIGYRKLICTPHILSGVHNNNPFIIKNALAKAQAALLESNVSIELAAAAEYMVDESLEILIDSNEELLTFGKDYMLIEMSYVMAARNIKEVIFKLRMKDIMPIIAHPERYNYYHKNFDAYYSLKERDVLFQVNLLSLSGYYGKEIKKVAERLVNENLVEFIGTDMHHQRHLDFTNEYVRTKEFYKLLETKNLLNHTL